MILKVFDDRANAELLSEKLSSEDVPNKIDYGSLEAGIEGFSLYVPSSLLHLAKLLTADADFTDEELSDLSSGKLGDDE